MVGVNQVIMLALNMVIISSMIGAGGLGYDVLLALRALKVGQAHGGGPRHRRARHRARPAEPGRRASTPADQRSRPGLSGARIPIWRSRLPSSSSRRSLGLFVPAFAECRKAMTFTTAPSWKARVDWINVNFFDAIEAFRVGLLLYVLNPLRAFFEGLPWLGAVLSCSALPAIGSAAWRLALLVALLTALLRRDRPVGEGHGDGLSVRHLGRHRLRCIGIPIGLLASRSDRVRGDRHADHRHAADLPSFCFIIPVVMLFRVGDFTA